MKIYCDTQHNDISFWVDKPYWVLVLNRVGWPLWVKISSTHDDGFNYIVKYVDPEYVEGYEDSLIWDASKPSSMVSSINLVGSVSHFKVVEPLSVLSETEFNEILEYNDNIWDSTRGEEPDDMEDDEI